MSFWTVDEQIIFFADETTARLYRRIPTPKSSGMSAHDSQVETSDRTAAAIAGGSGSPEVEAAASAISGTEHLIPRIATSGWRCCRCWGRGRRRSRRGSRRWRRRRSRCRCGSLGMDGVVSAADTVLEANERGRCRVVSAAAAAASAAAAAATPGPTAAGAGFANGSAAVSMPDQQGQLSDKMKTWRERECAQDR